MEAPLSDGRETQRLGGILALPRPPILPALALPNRLRLHQLERLLHQPLKHFRLRLQRQRQPQAHAALPPGSHACDVAVVGAGLAAWIVGLTVRS